MHVFSLCKRLSMVTYKRSSLSIFFFFLWWQFMESRGGNRRSMYRSEIAVIQGWLHVQLKHKREVETYGRKKKKRSNETTPRLGPIHQAFMRPIWTCSCTLTYKHSRRPKHRTLVSLSPSISGPFDDYPFLSFICTSFIVRGTLFTETKRSKLLLHSPFSIRSHRSSEAR